MTKRPIIVASLLFCASFSVQAKQIIVSDINGANSKAELRWLETTTGNTSLIGYTGAQMGDIASTPDGSLYGVGRDGYFYHLDLSSGGVNPIKIASLNGGENALVSSATGVLYAAGNASLYTINKLTGADTLIGSIGSGSSYYFSSGDLAFPDPSGPVLYMTASGVGSSPDPIDAGLFSDGFDHLIKITLGVSGIQSVVDVGSIGFQDVYGLTANLNGTRYLAGFTSAGKFLEIDPTTGQGTEYLPVSPAVSFLGATTVPEPSSGLMAGCAIALGLLFARCHRSQVTR